MRSGVFPAKSPSGLGDPGQQLVAVPSWDRRKDVSHCPVPPPAVVSGHIDSISEEQGLSPCKEVAEQVHSF